MKKIIPISTLALAAVITAGAAGNSVYKFEISDTAGEYGFVAAYDENGRLCGAQKTALTVSQDGLLSDSLDFDDASRVRLFLADGSDAVDGQPYVSIEATPTPTAEPVPADNYPSIYTSEAYAYSAPAMIKSIKTGYEDGEMVYHLTLLFWGEEKEFTFGSDFTIEAASDEYSDAVGQNASYLKNGDVILLGYAFKTHQNDMCLLYRPKKSEPVSHESFLPLYTTSITDENGNVTGNLAGGKWRTSINKEIGYSFGVVTRSENKYFTLTQADGLESRSEEITITSDTIVYGYDVSNTKSADVIGVGGIYQSDISPESVDDNGNITWNEEDSRCYALVRTINGVAADVMFFDGY